MRTGGGKSPRLNYTDTIRAYRRLVHKHLAMVVGLVLAACGNSGAREETAKLRAELETVTQEIRELRAAQEAADGKEGKRGRTAAEPKKETAEERGQEAAGGKPGEIVDVLVMFEPGGPLRIPKAFTYVEKLPAP